MQHMQSLHQIANQPCAEWERVTYNSVHNYQIEHERQVVRNIYSVK